ncbi:hypothetical protein [Lactiplantibacillus pentosus]|nr:hypothetical protein [Lactiplantibacillus pentosus]
MTNYILFRMNDGNKIPIESGTTNAIAMILPMNNELKVESTKTDRTHWYH